MGAVAAGVAKARADKILDQRRLGRHGRLAAVLDQVRRPAVGAGAGREPSDARAQRPARRRPARDRRSAQDRARRRDRGAAGGRGVRLLDGAPDRRRLHHDAQVPSQHLPRRRGHPGSPASSQVHGPTRARHQLLFLRRRGGARAARLAGLPHAPGSRRPRRSAGSAGAHGRAGLEGPRPGSLRAARRAAGQGRRRAQLAGRPQGRGIERHPRQKTAGAMRARARARREGEPRVADPQHRPHYRHLSLEPGRAPLRRRGAPGGHAHAELQGVRRPVVRCVPLPRSSRSSSRARPTTTSARALRRQAGHQAAARPPRQARDGDPGGQHHALRRDRPARPTSRAPPASASPSATAARARWSRGRAITAAST